MFEFLRSFFKMEKAMKEVSEIVVNKDESSDISIPNDIFEGVIKTLIKDPESWEKINLPPYNLNPIALSHEKSKLEIKSAYHLPNIRGFKITIKQWKKLEEAISQRDYILEEIKLDDIRHGLGVCIEDENHSK